jgi:hypothetical protein
MENFITWVIDNKEFVVAVLAFLSVIIPFWQYLHSKLIEQRQNNLVNFHEKIMMVLSGRRGAWLQEGEDIGIESQTAIIFELRNFPSYYPVIARILKYEIERWKVESNEIGKEHISEAVKEANLTIEFINKNILSRFVTRIKSHLF